MELSSGTERMAAAMYKYVAGDAHASYHIMMAPVHKRSITGWIIGQLMLLEGGSNIEKSGEC